MFPLLWFQGILLYLFLRFRAFDMWRDFWLIVGISSFILDYFPFVIVEFFGMPGKWRRVSIFVTHFQLANATCCWCFTIFDKNFLGEWNGLHFWRKSGHLADCQPMQRGRKSTKGHTNLISKVQIPEKSRKATIICAAFSTHLWKFSKIFLTPELGYQSIWATRYWIFESGFNLRDFFTKYLAKWKRIEEIVLSSSPSTSRVIFKNLLRKQNKSDVGTFAWVYNATSKFLRL